jgi:hypothetical protein
VTETTQPEVSDPDLPRIYELMGRVIADVKPVPKDQRNEQQRFLYRGIDGVLASVGPALRKHGVFLTSELGKLESSTVLVGEKQRPMGHVTLHARYYFWGPRGDSIITEVAAEAMDAGDKVISKAWSVALRTALLQTFAIPTDEPDADASSYERSPAEVDRTPEAQAIADAAAIAVELQVVKRLWAEASEHGLLDVEVQGVGPSGQAGAVLLREALKARGDALVAVDAQEAAAAPEPVDDAGVAALESDIVAAAAIAEDAMLNADSHDKVSSLWLRASQSGLLDVEVLGTDGATKLRDVLTSVGDKISEAERQAMQEGNGY